MELAAIRSVDLDWTRHLQSVWDDDAFNVSQLNGAVADDLIDYALACDRPAARSPLGRAIIGAAGAGKTHLVGELRRRIWDKGGWFVLLDLADVNDFWATAALSYLQSLQHNFSNGVRQGDKILLELCANTSSVRSVLGHFTGCRNQVCRDARRRIQDHGRERLEPGLCLRPR